MGALYSHTTRGTGTTLTAAIYNADHQNHIDNGTPQQHDDYSASAGQMQSTVDPGEAGAESLPTSLAGELERLRFAVREVKTALGLTAAQWYSTLTGTISQGFLANGGLTGTMMPYVGSTAPTGWVRANGRTIGSAASGATERANADTETLYTLLWNSWADAQAPVSSGRGASAAADFAANKTIQLPDLRGRAVFGTDDMGNSAASRITSGGSGIAGTTIGVTGGQQNRTITTGELPASGLSVPGLSVPALSIPSLTVNIRSSSSVGSGALGDSGGSGLTTRASGGATTHSGVGTTDTSSTGTSTTGTGTTGNMGTGGALPTMNPALLTTWIVKL